MDIQVRYTGSVEQFQNLSAKKKKSSHLPYLLPYFIQNMRQRKKMYSYKGIG